MKTFLEYRTLRVLDTEGNLAIEDIRGGRFIINQGQLLENPSCRFVRELSDSELEVIAEVLVELEL